MQEVEIVGRIVLGIALFMALCLGLKMLFREEEVLIELREGISRYRWVFQPIVGVGAVMYIADPSRRPAFLIFELPAWVVLTGLVLTAVSFAIRVWAQFALGKMWSEKIRVRSGHVVVITGPYHFANHPMYLSYFSLSLGLLLLSGDWLMGTASFIYALLSWQRVHIEDSAMKGVRQARFEQYLATLRAVARGEEEILGSTTMDVLTSIARTEAELGVLTRGTTWRTARRGSVMAATFLTLVLALNGLGMVYEFAWLIGIV